jgi:hypothetical protein
MPWTQLMDACLVAAASEKGATAAEIAAACAKIPFHASMLEVGLVCARARTDSVCMMRQVALVDLPEAGVLWPSGASGLHLSVLWPIYGPSTGDPGAPRARFD